MRSSFVKRIRPFILKNSPKIRTYVGAPTKTLGELLSLIGVGACVSPTTKKHFDSYAFYFLDNGAFMYWKRGESFKEKPFLNLVEKSLKARKRADFLVLPDLVGKGKESLEFSASYAERLKGVDIPLALALQDGMEEKDVEEFVKSYRVKVLFVGGTTEWKWRTVRKWIKLSRRLGLTCHVARVPSVKTVMAARRAGADSIDSTAPLWSEKKMIRFLEAVSRPIVAQGVLFQGLDD